MRCRRPGSGLYYCGRDAEARRRSAELPAVAEARMAALRSSGTWGSALTADEFAAIRAAGFEPVGQVFGAAVYGAGPAAGYACPWARGPAGGGSPPRPTTQVSGQGGA